MTIAEKITYRSFADQALHYFIRPHAAVPETPVVSPAGWRGEELRGRESEWRIELSSQQVKELSAAADRLLVDGVPMARVSRDNFELPAMSAEIAAWGRTVAAGRGFIVVRGLPVTDWGDEKTAYVYWGLGHHMGEPGAQNAAEELLGHVRDYGDPAGALNRQYRTTENIRFHCDAADAVGLLCLRAAKEGGQSRIVSSVSVFNEILRRRPDLAPRLFEPFALDRRNENAPGEAGHLSIQPACMGEDGILRTFYHGEYFRSAERFDDVVLDDTGRALIALYDEICDDPAFYLDMWLEPGDMQFISNHTTVHARTGFTDWPEPERKRHLLRLWLSL